MLAKVLAREQVDTSSSPRAVVTGSVRNVHVLVRGLRAITTCVTQQFGIAESKS